MRSHGEPIAIVGMACRYPDAASPAQLWDNILSQRRSFRRLPPERLRLEDYFSEDREEPDSIYATQAAVLEGYEFDRVRFRVVGSTFRAADLAHWLALDVASQALDDAGFKDAYGLNTETTGVILGNSLTGEFSRAGLLRYRWPYVRRQVEGVLASAGLDASARGDLLARLGRNFKDPFPPPGDESLAGGLSNTIAGRVCNQFDFKGGGFTVDGACASSLLAITTACSALVGGDLDVALAGGVDLSLDPFELVGFSKVGALAPDQMRVYDARSAGFWPGEGCGVVVLMRHEDALASGRRIYALLRGWGVSSDGSGGITRPEEAGQLLVLERAYRRAGFGPDTVGYFEGHGTGTTVGDAVELRALGRARRGAGAERAAAIGSLKANIGHTKAAAGVAGLIKATLALNNQVLPPTTGCEEPHPELLNPNPALRVLREVEPWPEDVPLRAGVSAMGFGGINTHVVLEGLTAQRRRRLTRRERELSAAPQDAELFLLEGADPSAVRSFVHRLQGFAARLSVSELSDLAAELAARVEGRQFRAAIVASTPAELLQGLKQLDEWLSEPPLALRSSQRVFLGAKSDGARIGFLFPGQGSPSYLTGGMYKRRFDCVRTLYELGDPPATGQERDTAVAQPAIVIASLGALRLLGELGVEAVVGVGHSLGELTALHWAGAWDEAAVLRIATARGRAMSELRAPTGAMAGVGIDAAQLSSILNGEGVQIAGYNSPRQTVISGEAREVATVVARAQQRGWHATQLPVSHGFHSRLVAGAVPALASRLSAEPVRELARPIVSTITGDWLRGQVDLVDLLCRQVTSPVRFIDAARQAESQGVDLWIEVGPGHVLGGLMADMSNVPVVSLDAGGESLAGLLRAAGIAFVLGVPVRPTFLFARRHCRPFDLNWAPRFLSNPCEQAPVLPGYPTEKATTDRGDGIPAERTTSEAGDGIPAEMATSGVEGAEQDVLGLVRELIAARTELPMSAVQAGSRLLGELHLNSINVGQLVVETSRRLGLPPPVAPMDYARATVGSLATALEERLAASPAERVAEGIPAALDRWVRPFEVRWVQRELLDRAPTSAETRGSWEVIGQGALAERLRLGTHCSGYGLVLCLSGDVDADALLLLTTAKRFIADERLSALVVVSGGGCASGFMRTLHLETRRPTVLLHVREESESAQHQVWSEAAAARGFTEARYDQVGRRFIPCLHLIEQDQGSEDWPVGPEDVLLVTGGGKGIAAECALALSRRTGARLALLGRSRPEEDPALRQSLARFEEAGIGCAYSSADVTDAQAVRAAVQFLETQLGSITGFVHGAGVNVPRLIGELSWDEFKQTLAPKVDGVKSVLAAVDPTRLRMVVTFGSIIARVGLPGEADYAMANEWLRTWTEKFQREYPACRCLALEWSVWSGVGMGERLGRIDSLSAAGVDAIAPDEGIELFCRAVGCGSGPVALVLSGRFGSQATLELSHAELPMWRFLEEPKVYYPGVELVADSLLSAETDPYLTEHVLHNERLLPAVMGLEAMAQAAMALAGAEVPPIFEDVRLDRPVVVPRDRKLRVRVLALVTAPGVVQVALRTEETGFQVDHFRVRCSFVEAAYGADSASAPAKPLSMHPEPLELNLAGDLYDDLLFHAGRFRRVANYRMLRGRECVAQLEADGDAIWFASYLSQHHVLGDTGVRDAAIHAIQACIPHARLLPVGIGRIEMGRLPCLHRSSVFPKPVLLLHARQRSRENDVFRYDVRLVSGNGQVLESWSDLRLRRVETIARVRPWSARFLSNHLERRVEELVESAHLDAVLLQKTGSERELRSQWATRELLGPEASVRHRADGKPETDVGRSISLAHAGDWTLAVAGSDRPLGCDLERVIERAQTIWAELLGADAWALAQRVAGEAGEDVHSAATRIWMARESAKKAGLTGNDALILVKCEPDAWVLLRCGATVLVTLVTTIQGMEGAVGLAVALGPVP